MYNLFFIICCLCCLCCRILVYLLVLFCLWVCLLWFTFTIGGVWILMVWLFVSVVCLLLRFGLRVCLIADCYYLVVGVCLFMCLGCRCLLCCYVIEVVVIGWLVLFAFDLGLEYFVLWFVIYSDWLCVLV